MFERSTGWVGKHRGHNKFAIAVATLLAALSMIVASAVDVGAALRPDESAAHVSAAAHAPIQMPREWIWRGRAPIDLEYMYGNHPPRQQDWIRMHPSE